MTDAPNDATLYDPPDEAVLDIDTLVSFAAGQGVVLAKESDVLDVGCGTGKQLMRCGEYFTGKIVGIDASAAAVSAAKGRLGPKAVITQRDIAGVTPGEFGVFNVVFCLGVISVVAPDVRAKMLSLVSASTAPGGLAVVSYYVGAPHAFRRRVTQWLLQRGMRTPAQARAELTRLAQLSAGMGGPVADSFLALQNAATTAPDLILVQELLNPHFEPLSTMEIAKTLGLVFVDYYGQTRFPVSIDERALFAEAADMAGAFRNALFFKA